MIEKDELLTPGEVENVTFMVAALKEEFPLVPRDIIHAALDNALKASSNDRIKALKLTIKILSSFAHE